MSLSTSTVEKVIIASIVTVFLIMGTVIMRPFFMTKDGVTRGILIDASIEGSLVNSCEIDVQYGKESSRIEAFSSENTDLCKQLKAHLGKTIDVFYQYKAVSPSTNSNYIIQKVKLAE